MRVGQGKDGIAVVFPQPPKHSSPPRATMFRTGGAAKGTTPKRGERPQSRTLSGGRSPGAPSSSAGGVF